MTAARRSIAETVEPLPAEETVQFYKQRGELSLTMPMVAKLSGKRL
jgi:hypothetical protein